MCHKLPLTRRSRDCSPRNGAPRALRCSGMTLVLILGGVFGCHGDTTGPAPQAGTQPFWTLTLSQHAINLALQPPYNTMQLTAQLTAVTHAEASGSLLVNRPVRYQVSGSSITVDTMGRVTAHYTTPQTLVMASQTVGGVTLVDTAYVQVTETAFSTPLATLSIQPLPQDLDSAKVALGSEFAINGYNGNIPVYATTTAGDSICSNDLGCPLLVSFSSSDPQIVAVNPGGTLTANNVGRVTIYVTTFAYGAAKRDSLHFTIGYPLSMLLNAWPQSGGNGSGAAFAPSSLTVGVGGQVCLLNDLQFQNAQDSVMVVFDNAVAVTPPVLVLNTGDLNSGPNGGCVTQRIRFAGVGTYTYHTVPAGGSGTITVSSGP